ncbi:MAG: cytochrome c biogenesis protein CcsA [Planctomycetota bacterium]
MKIIWKILGSYGLACTLLLCLFSLTILGTLFQVEHGLYEAKETFFNSWFLTTGSGIPIFPGGVLVMSLLTVNLILGGLVRIKWRARNVGVLIIHFGIIAMLLSSLVKLTNSEEGQLRLYIGQQADNFTSNSKWQISIWELRASTESPQWVLADDQFTDLEGDNTRSFHAADLPFTLKLSGFVPNCSVLPKGPNWNAEGEVIDGFGFFRRPLAKDLAQNAAGIHAEVIAVDGTSSKGLLWFPQAGPWKVEVEGRQFVMDMSNATYPMPFSIRLDKFTKEEYPGMTMAKAYRSNVTRTDERGSQSILIQMNEPLRDKGLVLFQSGYGEDRNGEYSWFSVVRNPSDKWPEYSLWVITLGLVITFGKHLWKFIQRQNKRRAMPLILLFALSNAVSAQELEAQARWSDATVDLFSTLPVQDGGRVKPMDSYAGLRLLTLNGKRTLKLEDGTKLDQNRWLLDVLFFPELANDYPCFRIQDDAVLTVMGVPSKKKRDWYSYNELIPGITELREKAAVAVETDAALRDSLQRQILKLATDLSTYESLSSLMVISRLDYPTEADPVLIDILGPKQAGVAWILPHAAQLQELSQLHAAGSPTFIATTALFNRLQSGMAMSRRAITLFPPAEINDGHDHASDNQTWWSPNDLILKSFKGEGADSSPQILLFGMLERLEQVKTDPAAFEIAMQALHTELVGMVTARGEYKHIPMEVKLYHWNLFTNSLVFYLIAFILASVGFLMPNANWMRYAVTGTVILAFAMATTGIVMRCIIRERPPVVTLYDTILFITSVVVLVSLLMEWITRQRIAVFLAAFLGVAGMFLAGRYELHEVATVGDTMGSVVAVLDTNYYLAIHVTTIAMGYAGGLLAAAIAHVWLFGKLFGLRKGDKEFYQGITRMIYGTVCFTLLFALFGTIMGGVWANDSWGRFWGWDPKENGALLICLWMLVVLHSRLGGFIRARGLANMAVIGGAVVSASWWGVNLLNVGLHSYGFTSGVAMALYAYWAFEAGVILLCGAAHLLKSNGTANTPPLPPAAS